MAHKILGVDLGAYSVKVVLATTGFRTVAVTDYFELPVPPAETGAGAATSAAGMTHEERAARVLADFLRARGLDHELPYAAIAGDELSLRILEFGFSGLKRTDLNRAVGAELEGQLPHDLEDLVYDFETLPPLSVPAAVLAAADLSAAGEPAFSRAQGNMLSTTTPVAPTGSRILAAATTRDRVTRFLGALGREQVDPRAVLAAPTVYARVVEKLAAAGGLDAKDNPVLVIDCGHARTNIAVVQGGKTIYARTLSRGGRHVTQAIAKAWNLPVDQAERAKHSDGFVASSREPAQSEAWKNVSQVITRDLQPLLRDLRQTLSACRAATGVAPRRAVLCGGGGRLRGLASYLGEELGLPLGTVTPDDAARLIGDAAAARGMAADTALVAHGVTLEGATGRPLFNLRKGDLSYRADFSYLRAKAGYFAACALVLVAIAAGNAYASLFELRKEEDVLTERLERESREVFGTPMTAVEVSEKMAPKKEASPLPKRSAYDLLIDVSKAMPERDKAKLDILELDIKAGKITMKATTDSVASIDQIEKNLEADDCFSDVNRGRMQSGSGTEKEFTLSITTKCL